MQIKKMHLIEETKVPDFIDLETLLSYRRHALSMSHISSGDEITASGRCEVSVPSSLGIFLCGLALLCCSSI